MNLPTVCTLMMLSSCLTASAEWQPLWPGEAPGGTRPLTIHESTGEGGRLMNIEAPQYEVYLPDATQRSGAAIVIFPGGGYSILSAIHEGKNYAIWLNQRGITAIVVKYRVSDHDEAAYQFPVPLLDARRAIRVARSHAKQWNIDPAKVGVMGSSAGGHLASMCATLWEEQFPEEGKDEIDHLDCRPDFAILAYPVIAMGETWCHAGSQRRLLGSSPDAALLERVATQKRINEKTPPCFLIHAADDRAVPVRNSLEFAARCAEHHVPVVCHVFSQGSHGFGLAGKGDSATWTTLLENWLQSKNLTKTQP